MGNFTFTLADKAIKKRADGEYACSCKLNYGRCRAYICYPDGRFSEVERNYQGYGIIAGLHVYEELAEMNKPFLSELLPKIKKQEEAHGEFFLVSDQLISIATAWQNDDMEKVEAMETEWDKEDGNDEWKRDIGIHIFFSLDYGYDVRIPYPLKIVSKKKDVHYEELPASRGTQ